LKGELYRPLKKLSLFNQVKIDHEAHNLVWTKGAYFDPATLHDWDENFEDMKRLANRFMKIWFNLLGKQLICGMSLKSSITCTLFFNS